MKLNYKIIILHTCIPQDPTWTLDNVIGVMEKVTDGNVMEICRKLIGVSVLEDININSKCSTKRELMYASTDVYVNCKTDSSWEEVARQLYLMEETAAMEKVIQSYLNPSLGGKFYRWVWFLV